MAKRTKKKRPRDVIGNAVRVMRVATGEEDAETAEETEESPAAQLGRKGGEARAKRLTSEQRREIAKKGAAARWGKRKE